MTRIYLIEERHQQDDHWLPVKAWEYDTRRGAEEEKSRRQSLFGSTPGTRWVVTEKKPVDFVWE